jgi:tetratricopeptide (TPR) repeat protein
LVLGLLIATTAVAQVPDGDAHWENRAQPGQIDAAIASYQRAVTANPNDVEARARLLRAWRFKGAYVAKSSDEKKQVYGTAKTVGEGAIGLVTRLVAAKGVKADAAEKQVADVARTIPGAAEVYLWDAVNWGEWALAYGKLAAARQGAADRIRREATIAHLIDPRLEGAAPSRVLGRLHDQTPRIPFITGWASSKEAVRFLNESLKLAPGNKLTLVFLAEAMVANDSKTKPEATRMLHLVVATPNDPKFAVEDAAATEDAKQLLRKWAS